MDSLSPNLFVKDIRANIEFYKLLGFNLVMSVPAEADGNLVWAMVTSGNVTFMFQTFQSLGDTLPMISRKEGGSLLFYIRIRKIRSFFDSIKEKVNVVHGLQKTFYGATEFSITDPNNYLLTFAEDEAD
ncbi:MAG TPA: VOC family protein [Puia sp.]|nr:VOC family protein [Puia sp.]